jgi:hypothetical protein
VVWASARTVADVDALVRVERLSAMGYRESEWVGQ